LVVGVHVSTIYDVDTMLLDLRPRCQMGWPDAYGCFTSSRVHRLEGLVAGDRA
jgi:hypothetical protein